MRHLILVALVIAAAGGGYYWWNKQPEPVVERPRESDQQVKPAVVFKGTELDRQELLAGLAIMPGQGFPASVPWSPLEHIGKNKLVTLESLLHHDPILVLEWCRAKYASEVKGYTCTFCKQERVKGKLLKAEKIDVHFCQEPFSVHMHFVEGGGRAAKVIYPDGADMKTLVARPKGAVLGVLTIRQAVDSSEAKDSSRFPITEFGIDKGTESTIASMTKARARGALHVRYEGVYNVPELDNRECYKLVRTPYDRPELEGISHYTLYIDKELMLQTGSILRDADGNLIANYFFKDVKLNPEFNEKQFTRDAL